MTSVLVIQLWPHVISWRNRFVLAKKVGGIGGRRGGGGGGVSARSGVHMAVALAGCRKALVGTGLAISLLFDTNGRR